MATTGCSSFTRAKKRSGNTGRSNGKRARSRSSSPSCAKPNRPRATATTLSSRPTSSCPMMWTRARERRGRRRALSDGISLPQSQHAADARRNNSRPTAKWRSTSRPHPLIIRTLDLGGDKLADGIESGDETESFSRLARDPLLPRESRHFQNAVARHPARERRSETSK